MTEQQQNKGKTKQEIVNAGEFIIKAYNVAIVSYPIVLMYGKNKNQVRMKAFNAYRVSQDISFKDFLKLKPHISKTVMTNRDFGRAIRVNLYGQGFETVFMIEKLGNTVRCVRPNCDRIINCHELDCDFSEYATNRHKTNQEFVNGVSAP